MTRRLGRRRGPHENPRARMIERQLTPSQWYALHYLARLPFPTVHRTDNRTYGVLSRKGLIVTATLGPVRVTERGQRWLAEYSVRPQLRAAP